MKSAHSQFRVIGGVLDLLGQRELVTTHTGTHGVHSRNAGEIKSSFCHEINRHSNFKILVEVLEILEHIGSLRQSERDADVREWTQGGETNTVSIYLACTHLYRNELSSFGF